MKKVLKEVLAEIKPSKKEQEQLTKLTNKILKSIKIKNAKPFPGGSGAKGTWLKGNHDVDIYVRFDKTKYAGQDISKILGKELRKKYKISTLHGSRDYFQTKIKDITIEFIPLFEIKHPTEATNITDISPLHTIYVKKYKKPDEIRLFKAFCKAQGVYGAESYKQGFSGYVCEILTIHYGNFEKTVKEIAKWKGITKIGNKKHIKALNKSKTVSPLILMDPVDDYRNASAALGKEQYQNLIKACKSFVKKPNKGLFIKQELSVELLRRKHPRKKILVYEAEPLDKKHDVAGAKLRRGVEYLESRLKENEFTIVKTYWEWNEKAHFYFVLEPKPLPYIKKHYGPPKSNKKGYEAFVKKWKKYPIKHGRKVYVELEREHQLPEDLIKHLIRADKTLKNFMKKLKTA